MKNLKILFLALALVVLFSVVASANPWTTYLTASNSTGDIKVVTTATYSSPIWTWTYDLTPGDWIAAYGANADNIRALTITLPSAMTAAQFGTITNLKVFDQTSADVTGNTAGLWSTASISGLNKLEWTWNQSTNLTNLLNYTETFRFSFDTTIGPESWANASAQDTYAYSGDVYGPAVPEPMSMLLGLLGLGPVVGYAKLRRK